MRRMLAHQRASTILAAALLLGVLGGCGPYSASSGRVDQSIKRVAVEYLENRTQEPDLGIDLADAIIAALQDDNTLKVVSYEAADSVIEGAAVFYEIRSAFISQDQQVDEYQVQIAVELTFRVKATAETIFERKRFTGVGNYYLDDGTTSETTAKVEAAVEITKDVLAQVVEDW